jgi:F-type H+-transporting ATPase subunit epsilon
MGVLDMHAALVAPLSPGELHYKKDGKIEELAVGEGFVEVSDNKVSVLIDLAIGEDAIDEAKVEEAMKRAQEALAGENVDHDEMAALQAAIAKSEAMLKLKRKRL